MNSDSETELQTEAKPQEPSWFLLVERIRKGDPKGMEELYAIFSKGVRFFLWRQLGQQDLDDKVHDVFLIVTQAIQRGELREPERLMGYVRTVVRRQLAAHIENAVFARNSQIALDPMIPLADRRPDPERQVIARENQALAMRVLGGLPKREREVLTRFYLREQSAGEICRDLDMTETQFRLAKSRAKARFGELGKRRFSQRAGFRVA